MYVAEERPARTARAAGGRLVPKAPGIRGCDGHWEASTASQASKAQESGVDEPSLTWLTPAFYETSANHHDTRARPCWLPRTHHKPTQNPPVTSPVPTSHSPTVLAVRYRVSSTGPYRAAAICCGAALRLSKIWPDRGDVNVVFAIARRPSPSPSPCPDIGGTADSFASNGPQTFSRVQVQNVDMEYSQRITTQRAPFRCIRLLGASRSPARLSPMFPRKLEGPDPHHRSTLARTNLATRIHHRATLV